MSRGKGADTPVVYTRMPMLRAERSISRKSLAEQVGVHPQTIGYIERGEYSPSLELSLKIARTFRLPVEAVFSLEPFSNVDARALTNLQ